MSETQIQVAFTNGLNPTQVQALNLNEHPLKTHLASVGVWYDKETLDYQINDDIDFWLSNDSEMVCQLRIAALYCLPEGHQYGFHLPLLDLPVKELTMNLPHWLAVQLPLEVATIKDEPIF